MVKQMNKLDTLYNEGKKLMEQAIDCYSKNKITEAEEYRKKANELYNKADILYCIENTDRDKLYGKNRNFGICYQIFEDSLLKNLNNRNGKKFINEVSNLIKNNKVLKVLTMIIKAIVSLFIVIVVSIIFIQRISDNKLSLGGYSIYTIITESMVPKYQVGDMVIAKKVATSDLSVEDDIVYMGQKSDFAGKIVTHQIIKIDTEKGKRVFHTKGIANTIEDPLVEESQVLGKVIMKSNILSFISKIVNNPYGFYFVIFVPFAILLVMEITDFVEEKKDSKK